MGKVKDFLINTSQLVTGSIFMLIVFIVGFLIYSLVIYGAFKVSIIILPWVNIAFYISFLILIFVLIPLSIFNKTKGIAGIAMLYASFVFGIQAWILGFIFTLMIWGWFAVIIGCFMLGVGVVPIAMLALIIKSQWWSCIELFFLVVMTFGVRFWGQYLIDRADDLLSLQEAEEWNKRLSRITDDDFEKPDDDYYF